MDLIVKDPKIVLEQEVEWQELILRIRIIKIIKIKSKLKISSQEIIKLLEIHHKKISMKILIMIK
jgi:hypothetical protein